MKSLYRRIKKLEQQALPEQIIAIMKVGDGIDPVLYQTWPEPQGPIDLQLLEEGKVTLVKILDAKMFEAEWMGDMFRS